MSFVSLFVWHFLSVYLFFTFLKKKEVFRVPRQEKRMKKDHLDRQNLRKYLVQMILIRYIFILYFISLIFVEISQ